MWSVDYLVYRSSPAASRIALLDFLKGKDMLTRIAAPTVRCMQAYLDANVALPELVRPSVKGKNHGWDSARWQPWTLALVRRREIGGRVFT